MHIPLAPLPEDLAANVLAPHQGTSLTRKRMRGLIAKIGEAIRLNTSQMLTFGPSEVARIAEDARTPVPTVERILHLAGGRVVDEQGVADAWARRISDPADISKLITPFEFDRDAIESEIRALLHAARDGMRNLGLDTTKVAFSFGHDGGYEAEAFGIMRGLRLLGYGFFRDVSNRSDRNLKRWFAELQQSVLDEEHFGDSNECDYCLERFGKDTAGRRRS